MSKLKLIKALRAVADDIESNPDSFRWADPDSCNCGLVAQKLLGINANELFALRRSFGGWNYGARACRATGLDYSVIFRKLADEGLMPSDIEHLEYLSDEAILEEAGVSKSCKHIPVKQEGFEGYRTEHHFHLPDNAVKYMRAWANQLCRKECEATNDQNTNKTANLQPLS